MRYFVLFLLAANAFLFSYLSGWLDFFGTTEADRLRRQVDAERVRVLPPSNAPSGTQLQTPTQPRTEVTGTGSTSLTPPPAVSPISTSDATSQAASSPVADANAASKSAASSNKCVEFPSLDLDRSLVVERSLKDAGLAVERVSMDGPSSYLVYLEPSESNKEAQRKIAELKKKGINDAFLMQDGPLKLGISLGLFRAEDGARAMQQRLAEKGIRAAKIIQNPTGKSSRQLIRTTGSEAQIAKVQQAASESNLSLKECSLGAG